MPCQTLLSKPRTEIKSRGNGWNASAGCVADTACALVSVSFRWRLRGEGPGADLCGRNESPLVRTSHPEAEAVPAREGQQPVESKTAAPGKPPRPRPAPRPHLPRSSCAAAEKMQELPGEKTGGIVQRDCPRNGSLEIRGRSLGPWELGPVWVLEGCRRSS